MRGPRLRSLVVMIAAALLSACSSAAGYHGGPVYRYVVSDRPAPPALQVLRRRVAETPRTLDPSLAADVPSTDVIEDLFEGLVTLNAGGKIIPGVASSWSISPDGRTYIFHLRPAARWSNGKPVTAADFVYAWRREVDPDTAAQYAQSLARIVNAQAIIDGKRPPDSLGVTALGAHTLEVRLVGRTPYFLSMLFNVYYMPLYPPAIRRWGMAWTRPGHLVSDGAFYLAAWVINGHLTLKKNPYYWDAAHVRLREEIFYPVPSASSALSRYLAGDLDFVGTPAFPPSDVGWLRRDLGSQVRVTPMYGTAYLGMLVHEQPFNNRDLRLALTMSLDRRVLDEKLMQGMDMPAHSLFPPLPGFTRRSPAWAHWPMARRLAVARRLYRAAGYSKAHPLRVKLLYMTEGVHTRNYMEAVATMWHQALGADIVLWQEQWKVMLQDIQYKNAKLFWSAWVGNYPSPYTFAHQFVKGFVMNYGGYDNPAYQAAVKAAVAEPNRARRYALYAKADAILNHDAPLIPLYFYNSNELVKPYVAGIEPNVLNVHLARYMWIRQHTLRQP
jgi:oligopeptide transport system substrate-binding protein